MEIVRAGPELVDPLVALRCELWPDKPETHRTELVALLDRPTYAAFLAVAGRELGFAEATVREYADGVPLGRPAAYLEGLFVAPDARRQGVATALLEAIMGWAMACGCTHLASDTDTDNSEGQGWHQALGFGETGRTVNYARTIAGQRSNNLLGLN